MNFSSKKSYEFISQILSNVM